MEAVCLLGAAKVCMELEDRWETIVFTCLFLFLLLALYFSVLHLEKKTRRKLCLGGADIKLMAGAMLFFGWEEALKGMLFGLLAAVAAYVLKRMAKQAAGDNEKPQSQDMAAGREIPLVPWLACGMLAAVFAL